MRSNHQEIQIDGFPSDGQYFIMDVGRLVKRPGLDLGVEVTVAKLPDHLVETASRNKELNILWEKAYRKKGEDKITVGSSFIPLLRIGSVFKEGKRTIKKVDTDFEITISSGGLSKPSTIYSLGDLAVKLSANEGGPEKIDFGSYPKNTLVDIGTKYFVVEKEHFQISGSNIDLLLVPCYEIARFYFLRSDNLTREILSHADINEDRFIDREESEFLTFKLEKEVLVLRRDMLFDDAPIIYRMLFSSDANKEFLRLRNSITAFAHLEKDKSSFFLKFPYRDEIRLKVSGRERTMNINLDGTSEHKNVLIVSQILIHYNQWDIDSLEVLKTTTNKRSTGSVEAKTKLSYVTEPGTNVRVTDVMGSNYGVVKRFIVSDEEEAENFKGLATRIGYLAPPLDDEPDSSTKPIHYGLFYISGIEEFSNIDKTEGNAKKLSPSRISTTQLERVEGFGHLSKQLDDVLTYFIQAMDLCASNHHNISIEYKQLYKVSEDHRLTHFPDSAYVNRSNANCSWIFKRFNHRTKKWEEKNTAVLVEVRMGPSYCYFLKIRPRYKPKEVALKLIDTMGIKRTVRDLSEIMHNIALGEGDLPNDNITVRKFRTIIREMKSIRIHHAENVKKYAANLYDRIVEHTN